MNDFRHPADAREDYAIFTLLLLLFVLFFLIKGAKARQ
jgi:hypothetical protein